MDVETLIDNLEPEQLKEAAYIVDPYWEDDYAEAAAKSERRDYSILDWAADVVREGDDAEIAHIAEFFGVV